jgi:hypothetical protein
VPIIAAVTIAAIVAVSLPFDKNYITNVDCGRRTYPKGKN